MNKFFKAFATVTFISVATRCLCFFFKIFLSRNLSLEMLGNYQIAMNIFMVFVAIISSGLPITLSREISFDVANANIPLANKKASAGIVLSMVLAVFGCFLMLILQMFLTGGKGEFLRIVAFSLLFFGVYSVTRGYLWGRREFFAFSFLEFLEEAITFAFAFVFLKMSVLESQLQNVALAFLVASIACGALGLTAFFRKGGKFCFVPSLLPTIAKSSCFITVMRIVGTAFSSLYTFLLPKFLLASGYSAVASVEAVGKFFGMVAPLLFIPSALVSGISLVLVPEVASIAGEKRQVAKTIGFSMQIAVLFGAVFVPFFAIFGEDITAFLFHNREAGNLLKIASFAVLPISINLLLSGFMNSLGLEKQNFFHFFCSGIFSILLLFPATKLFGEVGIVLVFGLQPTLPMLLNTATLAKRLDMTFFEVLRNFSPALLILPCILVGTLLKGMTGNLGEFLSLAISGTTLFAFCSGVFYAFFYPFKAYEKTKAIKS